MPTTLNKNGEEFFLAIWFLLKSRKMVEAFFYYQKVVFSIADADNIRSQITNRFNFEN